MNAPTIYGIRHHGPGCARSLLAALKAREPDVILLESPAEVEPLLAQAGEAGMEPPVAALVYQVDAPEVAGFYPFARFSPEWQAVCWALKNGVPMRCFDLPSTHSFALREEERQKAMEEMEAAAKAAEEAGEDMEESATAAAEEGQSEPQRPADPFEWFAKADGYSDGERWWNDRVEERNDSTELFEAILEAVTALRTGLGCLESPETLRREAWMRRCMRQAEKDGFGNIAVVCGAWHAPVLEHRPKVGEDNALLKGMPKVKVAATWTPWTYDRLATNSGYGAGVRSPGWYDHLWLKPKHATAAWLTKAARILRKQDLEGSSASIIEAVRLSESLAGLRGRPRPGLDESLEAMRTIFCGGDATPLAFLEIELLVGRKMGKLPEGFSTLPLQRDIEAIQKRLRLKPENAVKEVTLDLRENGGRNRSVFLHRLLALGIRWGSKTEARTKGTFKEVWKLLWTPELVLAIIDASRFGNTLKSAASNCLLKEEADDGLAELTERLDLSLLSQLDDAARCLLDRLDRAAATAHDTVELLIAIPALVRIARYGDVRETDTSAVELILRHFTARAHIELPSAVSGIDDARALTIGGLVRQYASALATYDDAEISADFFAALRGLLDRSAVHAGIVGIATRLLRDASELSGEEVATRLSFALSQGREPADSAHWLEGFLSGSGSLLVHDQGMLALVDAWLVTLPDEAFQRTLPMLRRTFGSFTPPERARIGATVAQGNLSAPRATPAGDVSIDADRARPAVETVTRLLNLSKP
jgi:hypothetical protein